MPHGYTDGPLDLCFPRDLIRVRSYLLSITAYPPSVGGAQSLTHELARQLAQRHQVQVLTQWDTNRTDWLRGTTLNAPLESRSYIQDGISVQRFTLPAAARHRLRLWVYGYYFVQGAA